MGGGLLQLVAYGAQDVYLTGNPQITFFKVVYRRHTNFAMESIEQSFNGNVSLGSRVSVLVTRNGDLINRVYFKCKLSNTNSVQNDDSTKIALVPYYGLRLLKNIELEIGGQRIDKHYSEWLYIWNELSMPVGKKTGYDAMVGGNQRNASVILTAGANKEIYVPLEFWFCRNVGLALPLIALQYHEVKINIEFSSKNELIDNNHFNYSYDPNTNEVYSLDGGITIKTNNQYTGNDLVLQSAQLWVDYIFLDTDERRRFAQLSHEYLIEQLQFTGSDKIDGSSDGNTLKSIRINFNHPCKELIWTIKPDNNSLNSAELNKVNENLTDDNEYLGYRTIAKTSSVNDFDKLTNAYWNNFTDSPYNHHNHYDIYEIEDSPTSNPIITPKNPVKKCKLQLNGNDRFSERTGEYFSLVQPYQHHEITPNHYKKGINVYSFALKPEEHQPSGTLNMSRIDTAHLQIGSTKSGLISIYAVNYNVLRILSGMGGLAYSN